MIKKAAIVTAGVLLLLTLMFGSRLVPYAQTAYEKARRSVNDSVPVEFQIDAARKQLGNIQGDIDNMIYEIAREQVAVERLDIQLAEQQSELDRQYAHIMQMKNHLDSGESQFVVAHRSGERSYSSSQVQEDLKNRFENYKVADLTVSKTGQILDVRRQGLESAKQKLEQTIATRDSLELDIESLQARKQMLDVAKQANSIKIDDSQLSRTQNMIDDIQAKLDVQEEVLSLTPKYVGSIPLDGQSIGSDANVLEEIDAYFDQVDENVVNK